MKITDKRSDCPIGLTLDVVGDRWSLLIIRNMMFGDAHTYKELAAFPEKIATNVLAERLVRLEEAQIIRKVADPTDGRKYRYELTEKGVDLMPIILDMITWGMKYNPEAHYPKAAVDRIVARKDDLLRTACGSVSIAA